MESLSQLWQSVSDWNILEIAAAVLVVTALFEKVFDLDFIGRRVFRLIWRIVKFLIHRIAGPEIKKAKEFVKVPARIEEKIEAVASSADERDARRSEEYGLLKGSLTKVEKEVALNGGGSIKDAVQRLVKHDEQKWHILSHLSRTHTRIMLRLDILDTTDGRMDFELSPELACTKISPRFLRRFGYTERDLIGSEWEFCIAERSIADVKFKWQRASAKHVEYRNEQFIVDSDGKESLCSVRGYPLFTEDGMFDGFYGTVEIISEAVDVESIEYGIQDA